MIWVAGSEGMLGRELCRCLDNNKMQYLGTDKECDVTDINSLNSFIDGKDIKWIVNCSAYTAVDKAEDESDAAFRINETGAGNLAAAAEKAGAKFIHISTDYVFGGSGTLPYWEDDPVNPLGVYGRSKLAGELKVKSGTKKYFIIRTSWLYGEFGNNFVNTMLRLFKERDTLNVVNDQKGSPTWAYNLAEAICAVIKSDSSDYGIYHFSDKGETTWYDFACEIYRLAQSKKIIEKKISISPITSDQYPSKVTRPLYSVLNCDRITGISGVKIMDWKWSLDRFLESIKQRV